MDTLISYTKPLATGPTYTVNYDFNYDNLDRLTSATAASSDSSRAYNQAYQYDEVGNMTRKTGIGGWEVLSWDSTYQPKKPVSVRFDFESEGIGRRNITYNHANKPVQISYKGGTPTYLSYDGEGERIKKVQGSSTTIYVGDIFEKRGALEVSHIYANGKRIISRTSDGKEYYTHTDHLGSTNLVTDETGQVLVENGYLPFGGALFRNEYNGGTFKSAYRYTGQELDSEYELYNYNARLYDPVMSRFISPDTIIPDQYNPQALNRYSYCLNNPLKYTDPSGHIIWADPNVEHEMIGRGKGFNFSQLIALDPYYTFVLKPMIGEHSYMHYIDQQAKENTKKLDDFLSAFENIDFICEKGANCYGYQQVVKDEDRWSATIKAVDVFVDKVINSTTWTSNKDLRDEVKSLWDKGMDINLTKHNSCGYTWPFFFPNTIYLGKCSWTNGCGPLESTLLHESLELLHYDHDLIRACEALVFGHNPYNVKPSDCK